MAPKETLISRWTSRLQNDKYYTPVEVANHCWDVVMDVIGAGNISEIIEPSCGDGAFYHHAEHAPHFGFDIAPQCDYLGVVQGDYLAQNIEYLPGRLIIGNPPFGSRMNLAQKFYKKSVAIADYIAFILPISQLGNSSSLYEFDLVHSEDLGVQLYTDRLLHCCFNVYRRPQSGELNRKPERTLQDITIWRQDCKGYEEKEFDVRMCYWGDATAGKILREGEHYSAEYKIKVNNPALRDEVVAVLSAFDWRGYLKCIAMRKIQQFHIVDVLKRAIKNIN